MRQASGERRERGVVERLESLQRVHDTHKATPVLGPPSAILWGQNENRTRATQN
jgi:hypothetical protein